MTYKVKVTEKGFAVIETVHEFDNKEKAIKFLNWIWNKPYIKKANPLF